MKKVNYENEVVILISIFIFFLGIIGLTFLAFTKKINTYCLLPGIIKEDGLVEVMVNQKQLKLLYANKVLFVDDVRLKFDIVKVNKDILVKNKDKYSLVIIKTKVLGKKKDVVNLILCNKRVKLYKMFEMVWKGESNANS